jgi:rare lipoprotein A
MANGRRLKDEDFTCASWDYPFGTRLQITNVLNGKSVVSVVSDRGPAKALYKKGRVIDLSKASFEKIADCKQGIIPIKIKVFK